MIAATVDALIATRVRHWLGIGYTWQVLQLLLLSILSHTSSLGHHFALRSRRRRARILLLGLQSGRICRRQDCVKIYSRRAYS